MNSTELMMAMKWKSLIPVAQINSEYQKNILRLINTKPLNTIWFGYQGFAWIEAFKRKDEIKRFNKEIKFISRKILHKKMHQQQTIKACDKLIDTLLAYSKH